MRANGTRTPKELANELARIDAQMWAVSAALDAFEHSSMTGVIMSDALADAWNAFRDAVTALETERRTVELNAPHADATAILAHQNID